MRGYKEHLSALMLMLAGIASSSAESQRVGDWLLQDNSIGKDQKRFASADDLSKKGDPLVLLRCDKTKQSDKSSGSLDTFYGFKTIYFVNRLEDRFWSGQASGTQSGWIHFNPSDQRILISFTPGTDGYHFTLDTSLLRSKLSFYICPSQSSGKEQCRHFSVIGLEEAVSYVCN
jgi:hypothetical protein